MERIAIFDLDGTLLPGRVWSAFVSHHFNQKIHRHEALAYLLRNFAHFALYKLGLAERQAVWERFGREIVTLLRGMDDTRVAPILETIYRQLHPEFDPLLLARWSLLGEQGYHRFIVSGSPSPLLEVIGRELEATATFGTLPEKEGGRYTGRIRGVLCTGEEKARRLSVYLDNQGWEVDWDASRSFADSYSDLPILSLVGIPTVVRPDPQLYAHAQAAGWEILGEPEDKI